MTRRILAAIVFLALGGYLAASAVAHHQRRQACAAQNEGTVNGYLPTATHSCSSTITVGATLLTSEQLRTGTPGQLTFHTAHLYRCRESALSADQILPAPTIAILHLNGTTWCRHAQGDPKTWLRLKNAVIQTNGTIVGLTASSKGSLVKLAEGGATVRSISGAQKVFVPQGTQLFITPSGLLRKPSRLVLTPDDKLAVAELQQDVVEMGAAQSSEHLRSRGERTAVVIGENRAIAAKEAEALHAKTALLTTDQVEADPGVVAEELKRFGAHSVFTAGSADALEPVWEVLRTKAALPDGTAVVYVAM